jgi:predicted anti-sigma-YlaC factor YlaD
LTGRVDRIYDYHGFPGVCFVNRPLHIAVATAALALTLACSPRTIGVKMVADALSSGGSVYATDDDPELVRDAVPFGLKLMEALLAEQPEHAGLLLALSSGFTQYGYAFVEQDADAAELAGHSTTAREGRERARKLYLRARDYGLRGLELRHPGITAKLKSLRDLGPALAPAAKQDVPLLYWTAASWGLVVSSSRDRMDVVAELPAVEALMTRALALDESWDDGAIHEFFVTYDAGRSEAEGGGVARARQHLERALALSGGKKLGALVSFAEGVCVKAQDRAEFTRLLKQVIDADVEADQAHRLANRIAQRRARMLLAHADDLFV